MTSSSGTAAPHHGGVHDLTALAADLRRDAAASPASRAGRTLVNVADLRVTVVALTAGAEMSEHESPGAATIQVLDGSCALHAGTTSTELHRGALAQVPDERHSLSTGDGCVVLLTVSLVR